MITDAGHAWPGYVQVFEGTLGPLDPYVRRLVEAGALPYTLVAGPCGSSAGSCRGSAPLYVVPHGGSADSLLCALRDANAHAMATALVSVVVGAGGVAAAPLTMLSTLIADHLSASRDALAAASSSAAADEADNRIGSSGSSTTSGTARKGAQRASTRAASFLLHVLACVPTRELRVALAECVVLEPMLSLAGHQHRHTILLEAAHHATAAAAHHALPFGCQPAALHVTPRTVLHELGLALGVLEWQQDWRDAHGLGQQGGAQGAAGVGASAGGAGSGGHMLGGSAEAKADTVAGGAAANQSGTREAGGAMSGLDVLRLLSAADGAATAPAAAAAPGPAASDGTAPDTAATATATATVAEDTAVQLGATAETGAEGSGTSAAPVSSGDATLAADVCADGTSATCSTVPDEAPVAAVTGLDQAAATQQLVAPAAGVPDSTGAWQAGLIADIRRQYGRGVEFGSEEERLRAQASNARLGRALKRLSTDLYSKVCVWAFW